MSSRSALSFARRRPRQQRIGALMDEGRIEFVTFHQSYGCEEFVEGLRPVVADAGGMRLEVVEGVLKRIADQARKLPGIGARRIIKMSLGDPKSWGGTPESSAVFAECIDSECVLLHHGGDIDWSSSRYDGSKEISDRWRTDRNPDATAYDTDLQAKRLVLLYPWHRGLPGVGTLRRWKVPNSDTTFEIAAVDVGRLAAVGEALRGIVGERA